MRSFEFTHVHVLAVSFCNVVGVWLQLSGSGVPWPERLQAGFFSFSEECMIRYSLSNL